MTGAWNTLPGVLADTLVAFKRLLVRHMEMQGIEGCGLGTGWSWHHVQYDTGVKGPAPVLYCSMFYPLAPNFPSNAPKIFYNVTQSRITCPLFLQ